MVPKRSLSTIAIIIAVSSQSSGKGGSYHVEDRYNPQHIDDLPFDIRNSILHRCGTPKALHSFARYSDGSKRIVLHFEYFDCDGTAAIAPPMIACTSSGFCTAVTIASSEATTRLVEIESARTTAWTDPRHGDLTPFWVGRQSDGSGG